MFRFGIHYYHVSRYCESGYVYLNNDLRHCPFHNINFFIPFIVYANITPVPGFRRKICRKVTIIKE